MTDQGDVAPEWHRRLARDHTCEPPGGCLGTVRHIDAAARRRGAAAITEGGCVSIAAPVSAGPLARPDDQRSNFSIERFVREQGNLTVGTDRVELDAHGIANTHLDALTHLGIDGHWHGGVPISSIFDGDDALCAWAAHGMATRAVLVDIPEVRGTPWVERGEPVQGEEIDRALESADVEFQPGDALLVYMGRDRFERAGNELLPVSGAAEGRPGMGSSAAVWVADHGVSILCWDFLDAHGHGADVLSVHLLIWSIGLALLDNCALGRARAALMAKAVPTGMLSAAPLGIPGATGCLMNPLVVY